MIVTLGVWAFHAVQLWQQGDEAVPALAESAAALVGLGPVFLASLTVLLVPAMVLTIELVHRFEATSRTARAVLGAASWAAWCLFGAITLAVASRLVLVPEVLAGALGVFAASGTGFSLLGFDGCQSRAGRALTLSALAVTAVVVLGSIWMAGRWSGTA